MMKKSEGLPDVKFVLPIISGMGFDDVPTPLIKTVSSDLAIRSVGRALGNWELNPLSYIPGTILTIGPNLYHNIENGMPFQRIKADLLIDGGGGVITEVASSAISPVISSIFPPIYPFVRFGSELYFSGVWESAVNRYDWRDGLTELLTPKPELCYYPNANLSFVTL
jgi:hypothetical protein